MKSSKPVLRPLNSDTQAKQALDNRRRSPIDKRAYINTNSPLGKVSQNRGAQSVTNQTSQKFTYSEDTMGELSLSPKRPIYLNGKLLSGKRKRSVENFDPGFQDQQLVEENLIEVSRSLKSLVKEYESKLREKKTLQVVVDQLKKEIQAINSQKQKVVKVQKKLENEAFRLHDMAGSKEHQRINMMQNIERTKDEVAKLDATVQADIDQNLEMVERINDEKESLRRLQDLVDRLKKEVVTSTKDKEIMRHEAMASAKLVPILEEKIKELIKDKDAFLYSVQESASVKFKNLK